MTTEELIQKFVEEVRHSIRKEIIAEIANGGVKLGFTYLQPNRPPQLAQNGHAPKREKLVPVEPSRVLEVMSGFPDGVRNSQLAALLGRGPDYIRPTLMELEEKGIVRREGVRRGTTWFRVEPTG